MHRNLHMKNNRDLIFLYFLCNTFQGLELKFSYDYDGPKKLKEERDLKWAGVFSSNYFIIFS